MSGLLPTQHTNDQSALWSIYADNLLRTTLELGLAAALGQGVTAKGRVTKTAALAVELEAGTKLFCEGVMLHLLAAAPKSGLTAGSTNYLYATITRAARTRGTLSSVDTWSLTLTANTTGTPPSSLAIPLAVISIPSADITAIDDAPAGKYLQRPGPAPDTISAGSILAVDDGYQFNARQRVTVRGRLSVRGYYSIRGRD